MQQKTILVIEDSPYLAESLVDMIEIHNYHAIVGPNGRTGIKLALEHKPDLILLDIRLPDIDGYEVYREIRADEAWGKQANIVVLTASESVDTISKNIDLPKEKVLFKPEWSMKALMTHLETFMK